jgi:hypothetical protein
MISNLLHSSRIKGLIKLGELDERDRSTTYSQGTKVATDKGGETSESVTTDCHWSKTVAQSEASSQRKRLCRKTRQLGHKETGR